MGPKEVGTGTRALQAYPGAGFSLITRTGLTLSPKAEKADIIVPNCSLDWSESE